MNCFLFIEWLYLVYVDKKNFEKFWINICYVIVYNGLNLEYYMSE